MLVIHCDRCADERGVRVKATVYYGLTQTLTTGMQANFNGFLCDEHDAEGRVLAKDPMYRYSAEEAYQLDVDHDTCCCVLCDAEREAYIPGYGASLDLVRELRVGAELTDEELAEVLEWLDRDEWTEPLDHAFQRLIKLYIREILAE